jgi:pimeloyl-ACP methyl ester carboxylesterase
VADQNVLLNTITNSHNFNFTAEANPNLRFLLFYPFSPSFDLATTSDPHQHIINNMTPLLGAVEEYKSLPLGKTFIRWDNVQNPPGDSASCPVLLLIHGATVPSWQFDAIVPELVDTTALNQYRVLRIDLYGHGRSARPDVEYNLDLFVSQVIDVIEDCCIGCQHIIGIGHSMGSAVLAKVVSMKRDIFRCLVLVAPMLDYKSLNPHSRLLSLPVVGEALMRNSIVPTLTKRRMMRYSAIGMPELGDRFAMEIQTKHRPSSDSLDCDISFSDMLLRMFRHGAVGNQYDAYQRLAECRNQKMVSTENKNAHGLLKVHVMWGDHDNVANERQITNILCRLGGIECVDVDETQKKTCLQTNGVTYKKLKGLEHNLLLSHPKLCADEIIMFLNRVSV